MMTQLLEMTMLIGQIREMHYLKDKALDNNSNQDKFNEYQAAQDKLIGKLIGLYENAYDMPAQ